MYSVPTNAKDVPLEFVFEWRLKEFLKRFPNKEMFPRAKNSVKMK